MWKLRKGLDSTPELASHRAEDTWEMEEHQEEEQEPEAGGLQGSLGAEAGGTGIRICKGRGPVDIQPTAQVGARYSPSDLQS